MDLATKWYGTGVFTFSSRSSKVEFILATIEQENSEYSHVQLMIELVSYIKKVTRGLSRRDNLIAWLLVEISLI